MLFSLFYLCILSLGKKIIIQENKNNVIPGYSTYRDNVNGLTNKCYGFSY